MYVLDSISTRPWPGTLDEIYPVHIQNWSPQSVEPGVTFAINYTVQNTSATTPWQVWGKLYIGDPEKGGQLISNFTSPGLIAPGNTYAAPATTISGGITSATLYTIEAGHVTLDEYMFTASENPAAGGNITGTADGYYISGTTISVTASAPNPGYSWGGWTATGITLPNPNALTQTFYMPENEITLIANFPLINTFAFTRSANPPAGGSVSGTQNGSYAQNYSVSVTASAPNPGYSWGGWTATGITLPNPNALNQAFNMPANTVSLTANYPAMGTGACCVGTNCYSNYTQAQCTTAGGTYHGDGSNCTPNPCGGGTDCTTPGGYDTQERCIDGYMYVCTNGAWIPKTPVTTCSVDCIGSETACIENYINQCEYGTWQPTTTPCAAGPTTNWLLIGAIIAASIIGSAFIIGRK